jgi:CBS domain-containing protein
MDPGVASAQPSEGVSPSLGLTEVVAGLLRQLDQQPAHLVDTANPEFLAAMVALEAHLHELGARRRRRGRDDTLADLIDRSPLSRGEKALLHELRQVRNTLVHNADVFVAKGFVRTALQRLQQIAARLETGRQTAAAIMTRGVRSVRPDAPLSDVQTILLRSSISQVAVIDTEGRLAGWVTHRSLLRALGREHGDNPGALPATAALADRGVMEIGPSTSLDEMAAHLEDPDVQTLAVLDGGHLQGVVTRADLLRVIL